MLRGDGVVLRQGLDLLPVQRELPIGDRLGVRHAGPDGFSDVAAEPGTDATAESATDATAEPGPDH